MAVGLAVAALAAVVLQPGSAPARPLAQNGPIIAYEGHRGDRSDIVLMGFDGRGTVNVTDDARFDGQPAWAPPHDWVLDEFGLPVTVNGCRVPRVQDLAFTRADAAGQLHVYRVEVGAPSSFPTVTVGTPARVTDDPHPEMAPAWSPGPRSTTTTFSEEDLPPTPLLAFVREDGDRDVYAIDPALPSTESLLTGDWAGADDNPDWSGVVTRDAIGLRHFAIAFESDRSGSRQIWTMDLALNPANVPAFTVEGLRQVTAGPSPHTNPSWLEFGTGSRALVYTAVDQGVQYLDLLGGDQFTTAYPLTGDPGGDDTPEWSPYGDEVLFSRTIDGNADIHVINPFGDEPHIAFSFVRSPPLAPAEVRSLTSAPGADLNPSRQPLDGVCAGVEANAPTPRTPSRTGRSGTTGGGGGSGGGGSQGGSNQSGSNDRQGQQGTTRRSLSARITSVVVIKRGRRRTVAIRLRVNARVSVRARLYRGRRQVTSRLWRLRRAGNHVLRLRVPVRARAGRHQLRLTVRPTSGPPRRLTHTVRLRR
jgi:Tol biopolymer transport system component